MLLVDNSDKTSDNDGILEILGYENLGTREIIAKLEDNLNEPSVLLNAYVGYEGLYLTSKSGDLLLKDEEDMFYLSIAPYEYTTHGWLGHNLVSCLGEMKNESFEVLVVDDEGNTVFSGTESTYNNGFLGIWLPKDIQGEITINYGEKSATKSIDTFEGAPTCETTMQLQ